MLKRGDIVVNPWVDKEDCGILSPCYATIYLGYGHFLDFQGKTHDWYSKYFEFPYVVIGHVDIMDYLYGWIKAAIDEYEEK